MSFCQFCWLEIQFAQRLGKWIPIGPDFKDHRESCAASTRFRKDEIRDKNHEARVDDFLQSHRRKKRKARTTHLSTT